MTNRYQVHVVCKTQEPVRIRYVRAEHPMLAAEMAERVAFNLFGGKLHDWFADKVELEREL